MSVKDLKSSWKTSAIPLADTYYRPRWVGGSYDVAANVALLINRLADEFHFYKGCSAEIINEILKTNRDEMFSLPEVCRTTRTRMDDLVPFVQKLLSQGLVVDKYPSAEVEIEMRTSARKKNHERAHNGDFDNQKQNWKLRSYSNATGKITTVMIETTYNCSERCLHCYNPGATRNDDERSGRNDVSPMSLDDYRRIIDELSELGTCLITLSGGDPFSNPHIWDIIDYIHQKDISFDIYTNGLRLTEDVKRLAEYFPLRVCVSLYSSIAAQHDYITRIRGSFCRTVDVLKRLSELGVSTNIKCPIMRPALKGYRGLTDIARLYGSTLEFTANIIPSVDGDSCPSDMLHLNEEEMELMYVDKHVGEYYSSTQKYSLRQPDDGLCSAGIYSLDITPDGDVVPCCNWHQCLGNVRKNSIKDIIENSDELKRIRSSRIKDFDECMTHDYCAMCDFCAGQNFMEAGTYTKPAPNLCHWAKKKFQFVEKVEKEGYDPLRGKSIDERIAEMPDYVPEKLHRIINGTTN